MKRRDTKKRIQTEERHVIPLLLQCLASAQDAGGKVDSQLGSSLGFSLTYLMTPHLQIYSQWPHRQRWLDWVEWDYLRVDEPNTIKGTGTLWWGLRNNIAGQMTGEPFQAELRLLKRGQRKRITYTLKFESEGVPYHISNSR